MKSRKKCMAWITKSTLKSPIDTKLEKLKGLSWCTAVKRVSKWLQEKMVVYKKRPTSVGRGQRAQDSEDPSATTQ